MDPLKQKVLPRAFYTRPTLEVARELVGKTLAFTQGKKTVAGKIVETEAYLGCEDAAAHSFRGPTERCQTMFGGGGLAYVYFSYGVHCCLNVVSGNKNSGHAVLIRALEPLAGIEIMKKRRQNDNLHALCSGPGKLCQALGIHLGHDGLDLVSSPLRMLDAPAVEIIEDRRIGISKNTEAPWRFMEKDSAFVSKKIQLARLRDLASASNR